MEKECREKLYGDNKISCEETPGTTPHVGTNGSHLEEVRFFRVERLELALAMLVKPLKLAALVFTLQCV